MQGNWTACLMIIAWSERLMKNCKSTFQLINIRNICSKRRAGLSIRHGTHVRGAPEWHAAKILSMPFSLRCRRRKFCLNFVTQKIHKRSFKRVPEWLPLSVTERLSRRLLTFTAWYSTVAENSESWLTCLCSVATCSVHQSWGPGPNILQRGPIHQSPPMIMLQHAIKSLKCITNFT